MSSSNTAAAVSEKRMVALRSSDGKIFEVEEAVAFESQTLKNMIDDDCAQTAIPLANVTGEILSIVIDYCRHHAAKEAAGDYSTHLADHFDYALVNQLVDDQETLFAVIMAAHYLDIKGLYDLLCRKVAYMMTNKSPEELRKTFNIVNDYSPEEEAQLRSLNEWAFESSELTIFQALLITCTTAFLSFFS